MTRFEELRRLFDEGRYFKLVCGAGNENADEVYKLTLVYTLAGANAFDVSAQPEIVRACVAGVDRAYEMADRFDVKIPIRPFINVSVGMIGDPHARKARITESCIKCRLCISTCSTSAITEHMFVRQDICVGCGNCEAVCPLAIAAIEYDYNEKKLTEILPKCIAAGAENIELHAAVPNYKMIMKEWKIVSDALPDNYLSMCLDRHHLSNVHLIERIKEAHEIAGDRLLIQADGVPMSGGNDDMNTTLQAIAIADIINKELLSKEKQYGSIPILLSGGTNSYSGKLARLCNVPFNGISIGTHARKIVYSFIRIKGFTNNYENIRKAVTVACNLIERNLNHD